MKKQDFLRPTQCDLGDDLCNYLVDLSRIKKGEIFYECTHEINIELKALEDSRKTDEGWACVVESSNGDRIEIYVSANTEYCGTTLYKSPQNLEYDENNGYVYFIV